jgi:hypothetical protein
MTCARIVMINWLLPTCSARTDNDILVAFRPPSQKGLSLSDTVEINLERLNVPQEITNLTTGSKFVVAIKDNDVHDLRLPMKHGGSRFPSIDRIKGD